ncbi:hypothetical protein MMC09_001626 [Bachmanniomyces sp. S44760]|nr:hypothetical protein [Bachmanniomyces sp. S44760]
MCFNSLKGEFPSDQVDQASHPEPIPVTLPVHAPVPVPVPVTKKSKPPKSGPWQPTAEEKAWAAKQIAEAKERARSQPDSTRALHGRDGDNAVGGYLAVDEKEGLDGDQRRGNEAERVEGQFHRGKRVRSKWDTGMGGSFFISSIGGAGAMAGTYSC